MGWSVYVDQSAFCLDRKIYIRRRFIPGGVSSYVQLLNRIEVPESGVKPIALIETAEALEEGYDFLQAMLDAAWAHGLRPRANPDFDKEQAHLKDLRVLLNLEGSTSKVVKIER